MFFFKNKYGDFVDTVYFKILETILAYLTLLIYIRTIAWN